MSALSYTASYWFNFWHADSVAVTYSKHHIVIPYTKGLLESIKKICSKYDIQTHFKGNSNTKNILVSPKDKDPMEKKSGAITGFNVETLHVMRSI